MPLQTKSQFTRAYRARVEGLRPRDLLAVADRIVEALSISEPSVAANFDFAESAFDGPLTEARELFDPTFADAANAGGITISGETEGGRCEIAVTASLAFSMVTISLKHPVGGMFAQLVDVVGQSLPRYFENAEDELAEVRRLRAECAQMAAEAQAVARTRAEVDTVATSVRASTDSARAAETEVANIQARVVAGMPAFAEANAEVIKLLEATRTAHQDVEDKQVKVTSVVNNAADFQRRIEESEQKARTTVEEVQTKTSATVSDLQTKSIAALAELQAATAATLDALRTASKQTVDEHTSRTTAIVATNEALHETIQVLLQRANAGELFKAFQARKGELERTQGWWLIALAAVTVAVVGGGAFLVYTLAGATGPELGLIAIKVSVLLPLVVLDVFIANQYNHRRALIEEYAFKAAISLSLIPYKNLINEQGADTATLHFVLAAVEKIYMNPSDATARPGAVTKEVRRAMKVLQDSGVIDLAKSATTKAVS